MITLQKLVVTHRLLILSCSLLLILCSAGCSSHDTNKVSGKVTFQGKNVPKGEIYFEPDTSKGGKGPQGYATIVNGNYETLPGKGVFSGPYKVKVVGYTGVAKVESGEEVPDGDDMFNPYFFEINFGSGDTTKDIEVPATQTISRKRSPRS